MLVKVMGKNALEKTLSENWSMSESRPENNVRTANCSARVRLFGSGQSRENISTQNFDGCTIASGFSIMLAAGFATSSGKCKLISLANLTLKWQLSIEKFQEKFSMLATLQMMIAVELRCSSRRNFSPICNDKHKMYVNDTFAAIDDISEDPLKTADPSTFKCS